MNNDLRIGLVLNETDIDGALYRLSNNESLYIELLKAFVDDPTMNDLEHSIQTEQWDNAFTAAHALKGLAGNMGFAPLFHSIGELVILIRSGKTSELISSCQRVKNYYSDIVRLINTYCK